MTELITSAQMRAIETAAIESGRASGIELMERAGRGVMAAVFVEWPELAKGPHRAVILCGPGNNGGDGFVVARLLREWGWRVEVYHFGDPAKLPPDAKANYDRCRALGSVQRWDGERIAAEEADLFVDALFGAGLTRAPGNDILAPLDELFARGASRRRVVAVDAPSGLCMDSGRALNPDFAAVRAFLTVTFHRPRPGHFLGDGPDYCGKVVVADIGLGEEPAGAVRLAKPQVDLLTKRGGAHKYAHGHAMVLSGPSGKGGAARLAARGGLRVGAGLVTLGCPPQAIVENAARLDAVMLDPVADATTLAAILKDERRNALCMGPGLGLSEETRSLVATALRSGRPCVLDADALTLIGRDATLFAALHGSCVLTPHGGEFARLFPDIAEKLAAAPVKGPAFSKLDATREAAARAGCVVLFKGADTVIAEPSGRAVIGDACYDRAAPWLATAGAGDVLAGFITGLLARGFDPFDAAQTAQWLHVECALSFGPGLIAEDLSDALPGVLRGLGV